MLAIMVVLRLLYVAQGDASEAVKRDERERERVDGIKRWVLSWLKEADGARRVVKRLKMFS